MRGGLPGGSRYDIVQNTNIRIFIQIFFLFELSGSEVYDGVVAGKAFAEMLFSESNNILIFWLIFESLKFVFLFA